ncbi:7TM diverse intracellular signaling domain-containing protein [Deltaproteobacteria bacterium TL4]
MMNRKMIGIVTVGIGIIIFFGHALYGATPLFLENGKPLYEFGSSLDILEDPEGHLKIEDIVTPEVSGRFTPSKNQANSYGFTQSVYWARFTLKQNPLENGEKWFLELGYPLIDFIDFYTFTPEGQLLHQKTGDRLPFHQRSIEYYKFIFPLNLVSEEQTFYLRFQTTSSMQFPMSLWNPTAFAEHAIQVNYGLGIYYGLMLVMILYNLFIFFAIRDKNYLLYVVFISLYIMFQMSLNGLAYEYLWPNAPWWANQNLPVLMMSAAYVGFLFSRSFLNSNEYVPFLHKISRGLEVLSLLIMTLCLFIPYAIGIKLAIVGVVLPVLWVITVAPISLYKGYRPAQYYVLAFSALILGILCFVLKTIALLPLNFFTENSIQIGSAMVVVLLSLGLADRINDERKKRFLAQRQAMAAQEETLKAQQQAVENLKRADKLKDEFMANTSHELRTPLNGIIGLSESILDGIGGAISEIHAENLKMIIQSGKRLANLVNDILDFSKMKNHELELQLKAVDLKSVSDLVLTLARPLMGDKQLEFVNEIPETCALVHADENRLQQIMINLIGNSIKFTHAGFVKISAQQVGNQMLVSVTDSGIGIPEEKHGSIFQSFEQGDGSTAREYGGTGLGLSVTQKLVELHGGKISVKSSVGKGSTFSFNLLVHLGERSNETVSASKTEKLQELEKAEGIQEHFQQYTVKTPTSNSSIEASVTPVNEEANASASEKRSTILIVDDEPVNIQVLRNQLSLNHYDILAAQDGFRALDILKEHQPDLILLDLMMPRMSGYEVCNRVREKYDAATLPIIMLTAKNQVADLVQGLQTGANDYLTKPFHKDELLARVRTHIKFKNAVENLKERERLEMELQTAHTVQELLIPQEDPQSDLYDISSFYQSASETGGDWYGYNERKDHQTLDVMIGDVVGHGVPAALITALVESFYTSMEIYREDCDNGYRDLRLHDPTYLLKLLNNVLYNVTHGLYPMTFFYSIIDLKNKVLTYTSAAHNPCYLWRPSGFTVKRGHRDKKQAILSLNIPGPHLSHFPDSIYHMKTQQLEKDDVILWLTDGLIENENSQKEPFSAKRLKQCIQSSAGLDSRGIRDKIVHEYHEFCGTEPASDDVNFIVAKIL